MSVVEVKVGNRNFSLACEDGQENHLKSLAADIDKKLSHLSTQVRSGNESLLLLMTALMTQDELNEARKNSGDNQNSVSIEQKDREITDVLNTITAYLENLSDKFEK